MSVTNFQKLHFSLFSYCVGMLRKYLTNNKFRFLLLQFKTRSDATKTFEPISYVYESANKEQSAATPQFFVSHSQELL